MRWIPWLRLLFCLLLWTVSGNVAAAGKATELNVDFAKGKWDASQWQPVRVPPQETPIALEQFEDSIGTTDFTEEQVKQQLDNAVLVHDTGLRDGEMTVTFTLGEKRGTAPGFLISPEIQDGVLVSGTAVFVTHGYYVAWDVATDREAKRTRYTHMGQIARWTAPNTTHVIRLRFNRRGHLAVQVNDSDVMVFRNRRINGKVGVWGCHGPCRFYSLKLVPGGTLPWTIRKTEAKQR